MTFKNNKITPSSFKKTKFYKELQDDLKKYGLEIGDAETASVRTRGKATKQVIFYIGNIEVELYILSDGDLQSLVIDSKFISDADDKNPDSLAKDIAKEVVRVTKYKNKQETLSKIDASKIESIIEDTESESGDTDKSELRRLKQLKADLTVGSGKLVIMDEKGEFLQTDGMYSLSKLYIEVFDTIDDAKDIKKSTEKIIKI